MKIGFFVNDIEAEVPEHTTTCLAAAAHDRGHEIWYFDIESLAYDPDDTLRARARTVKRKKLESNQSFLESLQDGSSSRDEIAVSDLDVLMLRNNPSDYLERPWAQSVGLEYGQLAVRQRVIVLNDPHKLANALNKLYFQSFPQEVRPRTLITRDRDEIRAFVDEHQDGTVLKPLQGSKGQGVFFAKKEQLDNLNQMVEAISRDGYVVAQEYLPATVDGDVRLFLVNGEPLECDGKYALYRRRPTGDDPRSNIHAGAQPEKAEMTETFRDIADIVRPKLIQDGMFLVGLDIAGDKLMEINVFSPGGLYNMERMHRAPFAQTVIEALEQKMKIVNRYGDIFDNVQLATF